MEMLENSLSVMFSNITSQFGFVNSLASKIRENERALAYAQLLVKELNQINLNDCYDWFNWAAPPELSHKIIRFIDQYKSIVERLASIVDRMKTLLFTLRLQEQTANRTRALAQYLKQHPEWEPKDWSNESVAPPFLLRGTGLTFQAGINTTKTSLQADFIKLIQELKRQTKPIAIRDKSRDAIAVNSEETKTIEYQRDDFETHVETLFAQALEKQGQQISALDYWKAVRLDINPDLWLDLVFAQYCCLQQQIKQVITLELQGKTLTGFSGNQLISEIFLRRIK
ncbi:conserved hypothetical protein [methanotrophic bacterial endosymbiont of Bathymodiolus sp.]|nr:conserved hypothetical protein [methanotrophic bacterial endosymbiont of Bathymodiolus sp.]